MNLSKPRPFLLLGSQYSGSTMLAFALDSHPDIHCERAEPLGVKHPFDELDILAENKLRICMTARGYEVAGAKVQSDQLMEHDDVRELLVELEPRVIRLTRNTIDQAISRLTREAGPTKRRLDPTEVVEQCRGYQQSQQRADEWLAASGLPVLWKTYEQLLDGREDVTALRLEDSHELCDFFKVERRSLTVSIHRRPLKQIVNQNEIADVLRAEGVAV